MDSYACELEKLRRVGQFREIKVPGGIDFSSNDYLGLAKNTNIRKKLIEFLSNDSLLGGTSSRLIRGSQQIQQSTEEQAAQFLQRDATLLFSSGYVANEGLIETLCSDSIVFSDKKNHSSLLKGIRLSRSKCRVFRHNDMNHLERLLQRESVLLKRKVVVTESLFSMDGDFAPLGDLIKLCEKYGALLIVDEAHATGVYGPRGAGLLAEHDYDKDKVVSIHTCGKALGCFGAFVGCSELIRSYLINKCHHFIYTTSLPPFNAYHIQLALSAVASAKDLRASLQQKSQYVLGELRKTGNTGLSDSQIIPLIFGENARAIACSEFLAKKGFDIRAIRYPTVRRGEERLRISIHADQCLSDIKSLLNGLSEFRGRTYEI